MTWKINWHLTIGALEIFPNTEENLRSILGHSFLTYPLSKYSNHTVMLLNPPEMLLKHGTQVETPTEIP